MPATTTKASSPSARKAGAPKAKGAVRAKSGCYTCRIRRKKCDENPNADGHCQTCVRLRLQCLGFGAKRPEWLRENRNVVDLREKIKNFLAAQGMIKGHSGTGPRTAEQEPITLRLSDDPYDHSSSSESPPSRPISLVPDSEPYRSSQMSHVRGQAWVPTMEPSTFHGLHPTHPRSESPYGDSSQSSHDLHVPNYNSTSLVPSSPALRSGLSPSYNISVLFMEEIQAMGLVGASEYEDLPMSFGDSPGVYHIPLNPDLYDHYLNKVVDVQYLLGDQKALRQMMKHNMSANGRSLEAAQILASIHWRRMVDPQQGAIGGEERQNLQQLFEKLSKGPLTSDAAMAALHVVSVFLFDGGRGDWQSYLHLAANYVNGVLYRSGFANPADALAHCEPKDAFVVKTVIWFDVLASITTQEKPLFHNAIRAMFNPSRSGIQDLVPSPDSQYSMMNPMGCENHVVWALAETSALSVWKRDKERQGALSVSDLVARAAEIERALEPSLYTAVFEDEVANSRYLASEVFRSSTKLFLRSVVSGDFPNVPDIKESVAETIMCIQRIPAPFIVNRDTGSTTCSITSKRVVRSTVFSFFICGCLTDDPLHHEIIRRNLLPPDLPPQESGVGNINSIHKLLEQLWINRAHSRNSAPVEWRRMLSDEGLGIGKILLV